MDNVARAELRTNVAPKSVQEHIDELPIWADGTSLKSTPMTGMQWLIWSLAAAGKFFEGFVVFMTGVALPLFPTSSISAPPSVASSGRRAYSAFLSARSASAACRIGSAARRCSSRR